MAERTSAPTKIVQRMFDLDFFSLKATLLDKDCVLDKCRL